MIKNRIKSSGYSELSHNKMRTRDWRLALNSTPSYKYSTRGIIVQKRKVILITAFGLALLLYSYFQSDGKMMLTNNGNERSYYNQTYPLTAPKIISNGNVEFMIGVVADLDEKSKSVKGDSWISYWKKGYVLWDKSASKINVNWDHYNESLLESHFSLKGRGMELSELIVFNGKLYTFDDRTGIVYELTDNSLIPWIILQDGNGRVNKGFKSEWAAVKDNELYVGGMGKEWTTSKGVYVNHNPMWVKRIHSNGVVEHLDWKDNYIRLRKVLDIEFPGYMIHESAVWSSWHKKWFFLPRRSSPSSYDEHEDEMKATNVLLIADENFENIKVKRIGNIVPIRGYSSFKFVPSTEDKIIIALKTEEYNGTLASFITAFTIDGHIILPDTKFSDTKFEGIEFI